MTLARIAMIVSNPCDPDPRVEKEAIALVNAGHEVVIHAFDREETRSREDIIDGVSVLRHQVGVTPRGAPNLLTGFRVLRGLRRFRKSVIQTLSMNPPDVIHCHDADTLAAGLQLRRTNGTKIVFDMHDLAHSWARMHRPTSILRRIVAKIIERRLVRRLKRCNLIVTSSGSVSKTSKPGFREWVKKRSDVEVVVVENRPESVEYELPFPKNFTIGYIGSIREPKMFRTLIDAIQLWPEEERPLLVVAGHGTAGAEVDAMLEESGIRFERIGKFSRNEIEGLIARISVMYAVYPVLRGNILEGALPTKMFDAAAYGRPSVVNSGCLMGDIARAENLGNVVDANDPVALHSVLSTFKQDSPIVRLHRDWSGEADRLIAAYKRFGNVS
ncbi:MAG: glycosyltransferase [Candidatus Thermoplasmatota archaeon]|nr:glycosyltransferase [Candidatus Thermoplasmatota archaeon]